MQTLDLECPSCAEMLELDAGFAGGVCRCSNCGTLMTVPKDAGKAETLSRPDGSGYDSVSSHRPRTSRSSSKKSAPKQTTVEAGEYRTQSGKVIKVEKAVRVPMAQTKRKQIRALTAIVFFGIVGAVVAVAVVAIVMIVNSGGGGPGVGKDGSAIVYDPAANPYSLGFANVVGLPVSGRTVIVVEASEYSEAWLAPLADMIGSGLSRPMEGGEVTLIAATSGEPQRFEGGTPKAVPLDKSAVVAWMSGLPNQGTADFPPALKLAMQWKPDTLVLVLGYADASDVEAWSGLVPSGEGAVAMHAVLIDQSPLALQGWLSDRDNGELVMFSKNDFAALKEYAGVEAQEEDAQGDGE